ncbi:MaoC family dehydratase [Hyphomicrobium sp. CS1GBMeth3]|uniref:MaoC family dehydratase n=1 Tax=Hyphomicrobium sp. CS1GBMeth3 TaxID=1892845 RepID=UPI00092FF32C|nr:MaoC family dehydratase [Hyphomicrobium sp. CS1GBMeth3]
MSSDAVAVDRLYFEDLVVGWRITTASVRIDAAAIKEFAASFDPQPFHLDEAAATESFFGGLVASGWHTAALTMRLLVTSGLPIAGGVIGAGGEITWPRATRPGDELTVDCEVIAATPSRSRPERGMVTIRSETRNQKGEVVQVMTARLVVPRRPAATGVTP